VRYASVETAAELNERPLSGVGKRPAGDRLWVLAQSEDGVPLCSKPALNAAEDLTSLESQCLFMFGSGARAIVALASRSEILWLMLQSG
jgi:hypothetical protein